MTLGLTSYSAEPIEARIVDADTGQPLEGVNVVAHWQLEGGLEGGNNLGQMMVMEAVTDANGVFRLPAWGPRRIPIGLRSNARLQEYDPRLFIFKSGYRYLELINHKRGKELETKAPYVRTSQWDGKTIEIQRFIGDLKKYADHLYSFSDDLDWATASPLGDHTATKNNICQWKHIPMMIEALGEQSDVFEKAGFSGVGYYTGLVVNDRNMVRNGCGSVKEFLREHEQ